MPLSLKNLVNGAYIANTYEMSESYSNFNTQDVIAANVTISTNPIDGCTQLASSAIPLCTSP